MRFFYDTEFLERGPEHPIEPISIGVVAEDGRECFAASADFDPGRATPWLRDNVLVHLPPPGAVAWKGRREFAGDLRRLVGAATPEWWGCFADYDHVVLCQLFGDMSQLPEGWPMLTRDLEQWRLELGGPELPPQQGPEHDALADARWVREAWRFLAALSRGLGSER